MTRYAVQVGPENFEYVDAHSMRITDGGGVLFADESDQLVILYGRDSFVTIFPSEDGS